MMKKQLIVAIATTLLSWTAVHADQPGADWLSKDQVIQKLNSMGYTDVRKLEADDGHWEGDAMKDGKAYEIHVDPHNGALTKSEPKN
jgi:hypothetical protein